MDPSDFLDIVDYWNLRAVGRSVLPAPTTLLQDNFFRNIVKEFIEDSQWTHRYNKSLKFRANIIPSTSQTMEKARDFITSLGLEKDQDGSNPILLHQSYPRIWDEWARDKDNVNPHDIYYGFEKEVDISESNGRALLPVSIPDNIELPFTGNPILANEISYNIYGDVEKYAEVFPQIYGDNLKRSLGSIGIKEWRIGRNGLVRLVETNRNIAWDLPLAEDIFSAWLKDNGWSYETSSSGKLAKELNKQIHGWSYGLANKKLIELIGEMAISVDGEGRQKTVSEIKSRMRSIFGDYKRLEKFIEFNIFSLGLSAKCPNCQRNSWYDLEKIRQKITCSKCLQDFKAIDSLSDSSNWAYKTIGPLSVPNYAEGSISVVLAVEFFSERQMRLMQTTPVYSFKSIRDKSGTRLEADFAFLWRDSSFGKVSDGVAFGEAKTFNEFEKKDFNRMKAIAKDFPGAVLVFVTLKDQLTKFEIDELKRLTSSCNKYWKLERPINPVLILTANELFSVHKPPYCWNDVDQKKYRDCYSILDLAKATQQKYLGIESWDTAWYREWDKKRKVVEKRKKN